MQKQCGHCKEIKNIEEFWNDKSRKDGKEGVCKICRGYKAEKIKQPKGYRKCKLCKQVLELEKFVKNRKDVLGYSYECKLCTNKRHVQRNREIRNECIIHYGGKCACCEEKNYKFLTFDHIEGNGNLHRREIKVRVMHRWMKRNNFPKGFQILCYNCNCAKGHYGICPHEEERIKNISL